MKEEHFFFFCSKTLNLTFILKNTMFYAFRLGDNIISSFTCAQKRQVQAFQGFITEKSDDFCCVYLKTLYPKDQCFRTIDVGTSLPYMQWKMQPICNYYNEIMKMVCKAHVNTVEDEFLSLSVAYPGIMPYFFCFPYNIKHSSTFRWICSWNKRLKL